MRKLAYLFVFIFASASFVSCKSSSSSCVSSEKYIIKNMMFENQEVVLTQDFIDDNEVENQ